MKLSLKILETNSQIEKAICAALLPQATDYMNKVIKYLKVQLPQLLRVAMVLSPEYDELRSGKLKLELGIPDPEIRIDDIMQIWLENMEIKYTAPKITNNKIKSSFSINMVKGDYSDVLSSSSAEIQDNISGSIIPWLRWLLLEGTATIIPNYEVSFGPNARSRTGFAVMIESNTKDWSVPSEYAGTASDNWITRAIERIKPDILNLLEQALSQ